MNVVLKLRRHADGTHDFVVGKGTDDGAGLLPHEADDALRRALEALLGGVAELRAAGAMVSRERPPPDPNPPEERREHWPAARARIAASH
jgi:hypothetical protein